MGGAKGALSSSEDETRESSWRSGARMFRGTWTSSSTCETARARLKSLVVVTDPFGGSAGNSDSSRVLLGINSLASALKSLVFGNLEELRLLTATGGGTGDRSRACWPSAEGVFSLSPSFPLPDDSLVTFGPPRAEVSPDGGADWRLLSPGKEFFVPSLVRVFGWLGIKGGGNGKKAVKLYSNSNVFMVSRTTLNKPVRTALSRGCLSPACCAARAARRHRTRSVGVCVVVLTQWCLRRVAARAQLDVRLLPMWAVPCSSACSLVGLRQVGPAIR